MSGYWALSQIANVSLENFSHSFLKILIHNQQWSVVSVLVLPWWGEATDWQCSAAELNLYLSSFIQPTNQSRTYCLYFFFIFFIISRDNTCTMQCNLEPLPVVFYATNQPTKNTLIVWKLIQECLIAPPRRKWQNLQGAAGQSWLSIPRLKFDTPFHYAHKFHLRGWKRRKHLKALQISQ